MFQKTGILRCQQEEIRLWTSTVDLELAVISVSMTGWAWKHDDTIPTDGEDCWYRFFF